MGAVGGWPQSPKPIYKNKTRPCSWGLKGWPSVEVCMQTTVSSSICPAHLNFNNSLLKQLLSGNVWMSSPRAQWSCWWEGWQLWWALLRKKWLSWIKIMRGTGRRQPTVGRAWLLGLAVPFASSHEGDQWDELTLCHTHARRLGIMISVLGNQIWEGESIHLLSDA